MYLHMINHTTYCSFSVNNLFFELHYIRRTSCTNDADADAAAVQPCRLMLLQRLLCLLLLLHMSYYSFSPDGCSVFRCCYHLSAVVGNNNPGSCSDPVHISRAAVPSQVNVDFKDLHFSTKYFHRFLPSRFSLLGNSTFCNSFWL